jgi:hypothetical protein
MRIYFHDVPDYVDIYHPLRLFHGTDQQLSLKKPVVRSQKSDVERHVQGLRAPFFAASGDRVLR